MLVLVGSRWRWFCSMWGLQCCAIPRSSDWTASRSGFSRAAVAQSKKLLLSPHLSPTPSYWKPWAELSCHQPDSCRDVSLWYFCLRRVVGTRCLWGAAQSWASKTTEFHNLAISPLIISSTVHSGQSKRKGRHGAQSSSCPLSPTHCAALVEDI